MAQAHRSEDTMARGVGVACAGRLWLLSFADWDELGLQVDALTLVSYTVVMLAFGPLAEGPSAL